MGGTMLGCCPGELQMLAGITERPATAAELCSSHPACVASGLLTGTCCPAMNGTELDCCSEVDPFLVTTPAPEPGSHCDAYPACVAAGLAEGACCPNSAGTMLSCCAGSQHVVAAAPVPAYQTMC